MNKPRPLKILATIIGAVCYLYGAGLIFVLLWDSDALTLNASTILSLIAYFVGVFCFWFVSESRTLKFVIPTAVAFPFVVFGVFISISVAIASLIEPGAKDAPLLAIIPTIAACSILYRLAFSFFKEPRLINKSKDDKIN